MTPDRGKARMLRIGVFSMVCVGLSAVAHSFGGGHSPEPIALALAAIPVLLGALWLTGRQRGGGELLAWLSIGQAGLHVLFHTLGQGPATLLRGGDGYHPVFTTGAATVAGTAHAHSGAHTAGSHAAGSHAVSAVGHPTDGLQQMALGSQGAHSIWPSWQMLAFHVLATLITTWAMARGEAALWRMARRFRLRMPLAPSIRWVEPHPDGVFVVLLPRSRWMCRANTQRGPPVLTAA